MAFTKKQQIRGIRILLTVFYGFLLSSILFRYLVHGIIATIQKPTNPFAIALIVVGVLVLVSIGLSVYATWFDDLKIMLASGIVLILVFILTLTFGIIRILKSASYHASMGTNTLTDDSEFSDRDSRIVIANQPLKQANGYVVAEDVIGLIIELVSMLFAILGTFVLYRYVKGKVYNSVPSKEPEPKD